MYRMSRLAIVLGVWITLAIPAHSEELVFSSIEKTPVTVLCTRILSLAYLDLGITIQVVEAPTRRSLKMANAGLVDGELFRIAGMEDHYHNLIPVPYPLFEGRLLAITLDPTLNHWDPALLENKVIGLRRGILVAERATLGMNTVMVNDFGQMLNLLQMGRIDVGIVSQVGGIMPLTEEQRASVMILNEPILDFQIYHYLHVKHRDKAPALAAAIKRLTDSGVTQEILEDILY